MVIERLERLAADLEGAGQTPRAGIAFEEPDPISCLGQPKRGRETGEAGADDCDFTHGSTL